MTRKPKGTSWTIKELNSITSDWARDTLSDGGGLWGDVRFKEKITISFRYQFSFGGKMNWHYCGIYPLTDMATIRKERDRARTLVKQGIDPRLEKQTAKIEAHNSQLEIIRSNELEQTQKLTFADLFSSWIEKGVSRADSNKSIIQTFNKYALPTLGDIEIRNLTDDHLHSLYQSIILDAKKTSAAVHLEKDIGQMMKWADERKPWRALLSEGNPAKQVKIKVILKKHAPDYDSTRERTLSIEEIVKLRNIFDSMEADYSSATCKYDVDRPLKEETQLAIWICLGTLSRIGETLLTEWRHVNFQDRTWFIPKANTKMKVTDQLVYLSDFTLAKFKRLQQLTGTSTWAFPARNKDGHVCLKSISKQVGDRQIKFHTLTKKLKKRIGNDSLVIGDEKWTPHDMRRTGATMMQQLKIDRDVVNLCQNHEIGTKVDKSYLLHKYVEEKREAWEKLGNRIEAVLAGGADVIPINKVA